MFQKLKIWIIKKITVKQLKKLEKKSMFAAIREFLVGKKTIILAILAILTIAINWITGGITAAEAFDQIYKILTGAALLTLRIGMKTDARKANESVEDLKKLVPRTEPK